LTSNIKVTRRHMQILLLSMFYNPEPVARPHDLAVALKKLGHNVSVITAYPTYPQGKLYSNYKMQSATWDEIDGIRILRVPHLVDRSRSALRRILSYSSFSLSAVWFGLRRTEKPEVIWTCQIGLPGLFMGKLRNVPVIHEVQDLWPDWSRAANLGLRAGIYRLLERQEQLIYRHAKAIVTITDGFKHELIKKGVKSTKIEIIPNWANDDVFHPAQPDAKLAQREGFSGHFNVVYIGNVGAAQALGVVLDAADQLRDSPEIRFVIIGDGVERNELEKRAQKRGLNNVCFLGSRPQNEVANYMALSDVLFIHLQHNRVYEITIPSKTYGYMASGRPILAAAEGELANLILEHGAGIVCPSDDAKALAQSVLKLKAMPAVLLEKMGHAGYRAVTTEYSKAALGQRYSDLFEKIVHDRPRRPLNV
jgi:colanic acid biosynthesis glycosyl transferase WcaI